MHQLLLLRHAKSSWDDAKLPDRERPLNNRGRRAIGAMRTAMRQLGLEPDLVLVSPSRRTLETLDGLEPWAETPLIETVETIYLASTEELFRVLHGVPETVRSVLLIGHNPGLHELSVQLLGLAKPADETADMRRLREGFPTCGLAEFALAGSWERLGPHGGRLVRFLRPSDLPEPAR